MQNNIRSYKILVFRIFFISLTIFLFISVFWSHKKEIWIWEWDKHTDFRFLNDPGFSGKVTGIAYLYENIFIRKNSLDVRPRYTKVVIPSNLKKIAVIRIDDIDINSSQDLDIKNSLINEVIKVCNLPGLYGCQVDYDVQSGTQSNYIFLINQIKKGIDPKLEFSITTLVSWCNRNSFLEETDADFAVPMFYSLGKDEELITGDKTSLGFMRSRKCQKTIGISTQGFFPKKYVENSEKVFLWSNKKWTKEDLKIMFKDL